MGETELRYGVKVDKLHVPDMWSLGMCLSHCFDETYLYINLIFITVSIGKMEFIKERL